MEWIKMSEQEPIIKDLPFIAFDGDMYNKYEVFEDSDWFEELTEKDRLEYSHWMPITNPK